jgi:glycosyltransferase involved in cell wall biosynthesis
MKKPIRILQVVTIMNLGGLESFLMNLYRNIDRKKIQFDFLMHRQEKGAFDEEIHALGGKIFKLNPIRPHRYFQYQKELKTFFKKHSKYTIIHSHINENNTLVLSVAKKAGFKIRIAHSHASATTNKYKYFREILIRRLSKYSTHNIACSLKAGEWLFKNKSYIIMNNSIDVSKFKFNATTRKKKRDLLNINEFDTVIGNVSRMSSVKNHHFIIKIFAAYHILNPNSKLILIGDGELKESIQKQIHSLGLANKVILTGAIQNPQDYLSAIDLYLFPSLIEGFGIALVEAQCNGLPILMSDTIAKDVILTNLPYQKSLQESEVAWANKILELDTFYEDNDRLKYSKVIKEKGFDIEKNAGELESYYLNLLKAEVN